MLVIALQFRLRQRIEVAVVLHRLGVSVDLLHDQLRVLLEEYLLLMVVKSLLLGSQGREDAVVELEGQPAVCTSHLMELEVFPIADEVGRRAFVTALGRRAL